MNELLEWSVDCLNKYGLKGPVVHTKDKTQGEGQSWLVIESAMNTANSVMRW